jgi:hypothetical protein
MSNLLYHTKLVVGKGGVLTLKDLPVKEGQTVEIIVYGLEGSEEIVEDPFVLRDEPFYDQDPFEPIAIEDWEALK